MNRMKNKGFIFLNTIPHTMQKLKKSRLGYLLYKIFTNIYPLNFS